MNNSGSSAVVITSGGNVGIGITSPGYILDVNGGNVNFSNGLRIGQTSALWWNGRSYIYSPADGVVLLQNNANNNFSRLDFGGTTSSFPALAVIGSDLQVIRADGSTNANLLVTGNVGIGTTAPQAKLHVEQTGAGIQYPFYLYNNQAAAADVGNSLSFAQYSGGTSRIAGITGAWEDGTGNNGYLAFLTRRSGTVTEAVRITNTGNVGIGTTAPTTRLNITGNFDLE